MIASRLRFRTTVGAVAMTIAFSMVTSRTVFAEECDINTPGLNGTGGATSSPSDATTLACGPLTNATGVGATAVGNDLDGNGVGTSAIGAGSTAVGGDALANADFATAVGADGGQNGASGATASAARSSAFGVDAEATAVSATAIGDAAVASGANSLSIGGQSDATGDNSTAVGANSLAVNARSSAFGAGAVANPTIDGQATDVRATALGSQALATNGRATAVGNQAIASGGRSTAVGNEAHARGLGAVAIGDNAETGTPGVGAQGAVAIGRNAHAVANGSVAIGTDSGGVGAVAPLQNEFVLGTANHTYTAPGITSAESRNRQSGPLEVATTNSNGHLATDGGQIFRELGEQGAGIAIAMALENPDLVGNETFGLAANLGFFEGNTALGVALMGVLGHNFVGGGERWAIAGGVGVSLNQNELGGQGTDRTVAGRAGVQVSW